MPDDFDEKTRRFVTNDGRVRSREEMRAEIDKLVGHVQREARRLAVAFHDGKITGDAFLDSMRSLLKSGHIVAASVGKGGRERMTASDWGRVGNKIKWQYGYLGQFAKKIAADTLSGPASANRASLYASALHVSYYRSIYADEVTRPTDEIAGIMVRLVQNSEEGCPDCEADASEGWMPVDEMGELGTRICGDYCKCDLEFQEAENA